MGGSKADAGYKEEARQNAQAVLNQRNAALEAGNALDWAKTKYDTGLYGLSVSDRNGTTWTPTSFQTQLVNYAQNNIPSLLNQYMTPTTDSAWYQANKAIRQQAQNDAFENQVINPLASRNLTRGSSVNALSNMFANDVARQEQQALLDESNRAGQLANTLMQYYQVPYSMMSDANKLAAAQSEALSNYDLNKYNSVNNVFSNYSNLLDGIYRGQQATNLQEAQTNKSNSVLGNILNTTGSLAGTIGAAAIMASDKRVKENIVKIGERNGYNWYSFNYKDGYGLPKGKQEGVIAQEVEKINPDAVVEINGIKHVDYSKLGVA